VAVAAAAAAAAVHGGCVCEHTRPSRRQRGPPLAGGSAGARARRTRSRPLSSPAPRRARGGSTCARAALAPVFERQRQIESREAGGTRSTIYMLSIKFLRTTLAALASHKDMLINVPSILFDPVRMYES